MSAVAENQKPDANDVMIHMDGVHKWFGQFHVLKDINLSVHTGERIVICGPSGSGKSTLIRCINRLEEHQRGRILVDGVELTEDVKKIERLLYLAEYKRRQAAPGVKVTRKNFGRDRRYPITNRFRDV